MAQRAILLIAALVVGTPTWAAETLLEIDDIRPEEIITVGFELPRKATLQIDAVGLRPGYGDLLSAYAWLLDARTREPLWVMERRGRDRVRGRGNRVHAEKTLELPAGRYELYMCALNRWGGGWSEGDVRDLGDAVRMLTDLFRGRRDRDFEDELKRCYVTIRSDDLARREIRTFEVTGELPGAVIRFTKLGDDEYHQKGFALTQPARLRIYSILEFPDRVPVDQGWIVNAETGERVWEVSRANTEWAGGARKNRMVDEEISLPVGPYVLYFATDDSHSWEYFNSNPPYDPMNWGITLLPGRDFVASAFREFVPPSRGEALIDLTRARNNDYLEQAFELKREATLHVRCLGEYPDGNHDFVDFGAIQDVATGRLVWEMTPRNTQYAGGGQKNRQFDGPLALPAGRYIAFYSTDDSHAFRDWNTSPPYEPEAWGLAIYPSKGFKAADFTKLATPEAVRGSNILAQLTRVRDNERRRARFNLERAARVHILCLGEGSGGDMYDYGWIEDARSGRIVWEMTYRKSRHAGGADKNRQFDGEIMLDAGSYEVFYITDGSHSFGDWNASRPRNPAQWGITVSRLPGDGS